MSSRRELFSVFRKNIQKDEDFAAAGPLVAAIGPHCLEPQGVTCRRCGDECSEHAIRFRQAVGGKSTVLVEAARCTGCGDCVPICPTAAISLSPLAKSEASI